MRVKTLGKTNLAASRHIKMKKGTIPVDVRRPKTSLLKLSFQECRSGGNSYNLSNACQKLYHSVIGRGLNLRVQYR